MSAVTTRRALLAAPAAATIGGAPAAGKAIDAAAGRCPDAALIRACHAFDALERLVQDLYDGPGRIEDEDERDAAVAPLEARQLQLLHRICELRASTLDGVVARARMLVGWAPELAIDPGGDEDLGGRMAAALLRDLARWR